MEFQLITLILLILAFIIVALAIIMGGATGWIVIKIQHFMAKVEQFQAVLSRIDAATTDIAGDIRTLKEQVKEALENGGLTETEEEELLDKFDTAASKLEGIAQDPENPTPDNPETPEQPETPETPGQPEA